MDMGFPPMGDDVRRVIERLGWRVRYVPHEIIKDYHACYRVMYRGSIIYPPAADRLGIPLNEVWLSERLRGYEAYVLFHELREIHYRYEGYSVREAHLRARIDEALRYCSDPKWMRHFKEFPDYTLPLSCLKELCEAIEGGTKDNNLLYRILASCIRRCSNISAPHNA